MSYESLKRDVENMHEMSRISYDDIESESLGGDNYGWKRVFKFILKQK